MEGRGIQVGSPENRDAALALRHTGCVTLDNSLSFSLSHSLILTAGR